MKRLISTCALMFLGLTSVSGAADEFVGSWKLNVAKSKNLPGDESAPWPKELILTIEEHGADLVVIEKEVSSDGRMRSNAVRVSSKGGPATPIEGLTLAADQSLVLKKIGTDTMIRELDQGGKPIRTGHMTVSADGKTMTVEEKGGSNNPQRQDKKIDRIEVFDRQ